LFPACAVDFREVSTAETRGELAQLGERIIITRDSVVVVDDELTVLFPVPGPAPPPFRPM
jgi:hypothetical protein